MSAASERLTELLREVSNSRRRLEALASRVSAVREQMDGGRPPGHVGAQPQDEPEDEIQFFEEDGPHTGVVEGGELSFEASDIDDSKQKRG